jgi:hydrogenase/urease accessory protein HupE
VKRFVRLVLGVVAVLVALAPVPLRAHELHPGFLELHEVGPGRYDVLWKQPLVGEVRMEIAPIFPDTCRQIGEVRSERTPTAWLSTTHIACTPGLAGQSIAIDGLDAYATDVLVRVEYAGGVAETLIAKPAQPAVRLRAADDAPRGPWAYVNLGIEHILLGFDHLLFVLGLLLIVPDRWMLLKTITAFTVAHSITLAAATLGLANVPAAPVEATIALSILFLGPEIVRRWRGESSFTMRHPWVVAFAFGLLHGFGFAGALAQLGLPRSEVPLALLLFNVGVEIGQLGFVAVVLLSERTFRRLDLHWPTLVARLPGYVVGTFGAYWTIQRVAVLLRGMA